MQFIVYYAMRAAHRIQLFTNIKAIKHIKTKNELYAKNMSISHLSAYFYHSVQCLDRILIAGANNSNCTVYLHASVGNIKLSDYDNLFKNVNCFSSIKYENGRE